MLGTKAQKMFHDSINKDAFFKYMKGWLVQEGLNHLQITVYSAKTDIRKTFSYR
jgi:hypothetical protein